MEMRYGREDYSNIQSIILSKYLAKLILTMRGNTPKCYIAKYLAECILNKNKLAATNIHTDLLDKVRDKIDEDEPVFLIRASDAVSGDTVRAWACLAQIAGANNRIITSALRQAKRMDKWKVKKIPDL